MFVAASSRCFPELALPVCLERLADLEYTASEIVIGTGKSDLSPDLVLQDPVMAMQYCTKERAIRPIAFFLDIVPEDPDYMKKFVGCCRIAKVLRIITIVVRSGVIGTPYNEEIERLRTLTRYGLAQGITIGIQNQSGCIADTPESIASLCSSVPNLEISIDPSYFIYAQNRAIDYDSITSLCCHIRLRDTTKTKFQVQIGQGVLDYGKLITQLTKSKYNRALSVDIAPLAEINQASEMRKMRLLLESIL